MNGAPNIEYQYSTIGNLTVKKEISGDESVDYTSLSYGFTGTPKRPHAVSTATPQTGTAHTFEYDAIGNMLKEKVGTTDLHVYTYDAAGQAYSRTTSGETTLYFYDGDGQLARKVSPGQTKGTVYIGDIFERNLDTGETTRYYYVNGTRIAMMTGNSNPVFATKHYLVDDLLGSTALVTDSSNNVIGRLRYFPFGSMRDEVWSGPALTDKLFTGQQREVDASTTGVYHYQARLYNNNIGRFPQADTFVPDPSVPSALNRYSYVYNNPTTLTDPTGHFGCFCGDLVGGTWPSWDSGWPVPSSSNPEFHPARPIIPPFDEEMDLIGCYTSAGWAAGGKATPNTYRFKWWVKADCAKAKFVLTTVSGELIRVVRSKEDLLIVFESLDAAERACLGSYCDAQGVRSQLGLTVRKGRYTIMHCAQGTGLRWQIAIPLCGYTYIRVKGPYEVIEYQ